MSFRQGAAHRDALALAQLVASIGAATERDRDAAMKYVRDRSAIDAFDHDVSQDIARLLALSQPMARNLHELFAASRISANIECSGDDAVNIARAQWLSPVRTGATRFRAAAPCASRGKSAL